MKLNLVFSNRRLLVNGGADACAGGRLQRVRSRHVLRCLIFVILLFSGFAADAAPQADKPVQASGGNLNSHVDGLEARFSGLENRLGGLHSAALEALGAVDATKRVVSNVKKLNSEADALKSDIEKLKESLDDKGRNLDVSGGGDQVEARTRQAKNIGEKIKRCEKLLGECGTVRPKLEELERTLEEAQTFRGAMDDVFGKQKAESQTREAVGPRLTELLGPATQKIPPVSSVGAPSHGTQPPESTGGDVASGESVLQSTALGDSNWGMWGSWIAGILFVLLLLKSKSSKGASPPLSPKPDIESVEKAPTLPKADPVPTPLKAPDALKDHAAKNVLSLIAGDGSKVIETRLDLDFGRHVLLHGFEGKQYFGEKQFRLTTTAEGWFFVSMKEKNINNVNGLEVPFGTRIPLTEGDVISIGKKQVCPLRVSLG